MQDLAPLQELEYSTEQIGDVSADRSIRLSYINRVRIPIWVRVSNAVGCSFVTTFD